MYFENADGLARLQSEAVRCGPPPRMFIDCLNYMY